MNTEPTLKTLLVQMQNQINAFTCFKEQRPDIYASEMKGVSGRGKQRMSEDQYNYLTKHYKVLLVKLGYEI